GEDPEVLALRLRALADTARHRSLDLVWRPQAPVAQLELYGQARRGLHAVAAPRLADTGLHRAQCLAVGVAGLEPGLYQTLPDPGKVLDPRTEQVDPLCLRDLGVQVELLSRTTALCRSSPAYPRRTGRPRSGRCRSAPGG